MMKKSSASSARDGLVRMTSEDIRRRKWSKSEIEAVRRAAERRAAGEELPEAEYDDIPRLTPEQLANMVRLRDVPRRLR